MDDLRDANDPEAPIVGTIKVAPKTDIHTITTISAEAARAAALTYYPAGEIDDIELEVEDGYLVWEIELDAANLEVEILVDAGNGSVLRRVIEDDD